MLHEAGRDLALLNAVPVAGFGWLRRDTVTGECLAGELETWATFVEEEVREAFDLAGHLLSPAERDDIAALLALGDWLATKRAWLAHGDLDPCHIYVHQGGYAGLIDIGEMRGTDRCFDLGHVRVGEIERGGPPLLPGLLRGYQESTPLPEGSNRRIRLDALLIELRLLGRHALKGRTTAPTLRAVRQLCAESRTCYDRQG